MQQTDRHTLATDRTDLVDLRNPPEQHEQHQGPQLLDPRVLRRVGGGVGEPPPVGGADLPKGGW